MTDRNGKGYCQITQAGSEDGEQFDLHEQVLPTGIQLIPMNEIRQLQ